MRRAIEAVGVGLAIVSVAAGCGSPELPPPPSVTSSPAPTLDPNFNCAPEVAAHSLNVGAITTEEAVEILASTVDPCYRRAPDANRQSASHTWRSVMLRMVNGGVVQIGESSHVPDNFNFSELDAIQAELYPKGATPTDLSGAPSILLTFSNGPDSGWQAKWQAGSQNVAATPDAQGNLYVVPTPPLPNVRVDDRQVACNTFMEIAEETRALLAHANSAAFPDVSFPIPPHSLVGGSPQRCYTGK